MSDDLLSDHVLLFLLISFTYYLARSHPPTTQPHQLLKHTLYAYLCMSLKVFNSFKIFSSAPPGSDMCINPIQSLQSLLLVPLSALSPRSWGSGRTWCSWTLQRFAWQHLWCRIPQPTAWCNRGRKMRPDHRWHTGNIECWREGEKKTCGYKEPQPFKERLQPKKSWKKWCKCLNLPLTCRQGWCSPEGYGQSRSRWVSLSLWVPDVHSHRRAQCQRNTSAWRPGSSTAPRPNIAYSSRSNLPKCGTSQSQATKLSDAIWQATRKEQSSMCLLVEEELILLSSF